MNAYQSKLARCTSQRRSKGFTLTEIAIVLGIIGLILGAVWSAASSVYSNANATKFSEQLGVYVASARTLCGNGCAPSSPINGISASVPLIPGVSLVNGYPATDAAGSTMIVGWTGVPSSSAGTNFCNSLAQAVSSIGGLPANTAANADVSVPQTVICAKNKPPVCNGNMPNYTLQLQGGGTCTVANTMPAGDQCVATSSVSLCGGGQGSDFYAGFPLNF